MNHLNDYQSSIIRRAIKILDSQLKEKPAMNSPGAVKLYFRTRLQMLERETFSVMFLDSQNKLIKYSEIFYGTINKTSIHPREIVKEVLTNNAAAVIFAHNHPSGNPEASQADKQITSVLQEALRLIDVKVLDHIIVAGGECVSFAERGWIR